MSPFCGAQAGAASPPVLDCAGNLFARHFVVLATGMPACSLHLIELGAHSVTAERFLADILARDAEVVLASRIRFDVVQATVLDAEELRGPWHLLYLTRTEATPVHDAIARRYSLRVGVPSRILNDYPATNARLLSAPRPPLTGSLDRAKPHATSQGLELSDALRRDGAALGVHYDGPVTQLNLLHFNTGMKAEYAKYGQTFAETGGKRGGNAKIVGNVIPSSSDSSGGRTGEGETGWWNELALAHYPSIEHFMDMVAGEDYQEGNRRYRQKALRDTVLMCTTEYDLTTLRGRGAKL